MRWFLLRRLGWAALVVWATLSLTFGFVALTPDPNAAEAAFYAELRGGDSENTVSAYAAATNRDEPVLERYGRWMMGYATFNWGHSRALSGKSVTGLIVEYAVPTLAYLVPALAVAVLGGVAVGLYAATRPGTLWADVGRTTAYLGFCLPPFFVAYLVHTGVGNYVEIVPAFYQTSRPVTSPENLSFLIVPGAGVATYLLAVQVRYTRSESIDHATSEAIKLVRAKGAGNWRVARHVLRNAVIPLLSLFFTELVGMVLVLVILFEYTYQVPGFGRLIYLAITERDVALVLGTAVVPVAVGVFGNLLQDVAYTMLDPRVEFDD